MSTIRTLYLETAGRAIDLIADPETAARWEQPSVLARMSIGDLAGHLARSILQVEWYLDAPHRDTTPVDAARYFIREGDPADLDSAHNQGIRKRSTEIARQGYEQLVSSTRATLDRLRDRLPAEPNGRLLEALGWVLPLDEYLKTRLVEITVHFDDLRLSTGSTEGPLPAEAIEVAVDTLLDVARRRHGMAAVLTALARRERDAVQALRVF
jgi:hypothetical protein